jgi:predicted dithiol-disulfide oxidoreductase (DUF899 family)
MDHSKVVSRDEWLAARKQHLSKEKEFTRLRDKLSAERRELPWVKVEKNYIFDAPKGRKTLADLFEGRSQLIVSHSCSVPSGSRVARAALSCPIISTAASRISRHRDVTFVVVSRAPLPKIEAFKKRMGWRFKWVSSYGNDFNFDYIVSFTKHEMAKGKVYYNYDKTEFPSDEGPGISVFYKDGTGEIFHTYSSYARGLDILVGAYNYLDLVPKGRDEAELPWTMAWVRHHGNYGD